MEKQDDYYDIILIQLYNYMERKQKYRFKKYKKYLLSRE